MNASPLPPHAKRRRIGLAGAGLLGRLLALQLAQAGHAVEVFDPAAGPLARGAAGWTAAGMLSPVAELECADEDVFALGLRSIELWPQIVAGLHQPVQLRIEGSLLLAHRGDEGAARRVVDLMEAKAPAGHAPQRLDAATLRELEPGVQPVPNAWLLPHEGQIDTVAAMQGLAEAAAALGATFHWGAPATAVRAGGIEAGGQRHAFDHVFDVRGTGARPDRPVRGVRGEIVWLHAPGVPLNRPMRLLHPRHRVYIVPRPGDHVLVGASEIESEDRSPISVRTIVELLTAAHSVLPGLAEARVVHTDTNLRPALPDNLPEVRHEAGLTVVNGLFRHGWLIGPALAERALAAFHESTE